MLSLYLIERYVENGHHEPLLDRLIDNGLELPLPLRIRLAASPATTLGLALRRVTELTYGPTRLAQRLTDALLSRQGPDGGIDADPLATAGFISACDGLAADPRQAADPRLESARERAIEGLAAMQDEHGLLHGTEDRSLEQRELITAFVLSLLAEDGDLRASIRMADVLSHFEDREDRLDPGTRRLWMLSQLPARHSQHQAHGEPAVAA
jgi:hypothetical protein